MGKPKRSSLFILRHFARNEPGSQADFWLPGKYVGAIFADNCERWSFLSPPGTSRIGHSGFWVCMVVTFCRLERFI